MFWGRSQVPAPFPTLREPDTLPEGIFISDGTATILPSAISPSCYSRLIGRKGATLKELRERFSAEIRLPSLSDQQKSPESCQISVVAPEPRAVVAALLELAASVRPARSPVQRSPSSKRLTHFVALPTHCEALAPAWVAAKAALAALAPRADAEDLMAAFQPEYRQHVTIVPLSLPRGEVARAIAAFEACTPELQRLCRPIPAPTLAYGPVSTFKDSSPQATHVLFSDPVTNLPLEALSRALYAALDEWALDKGRPFAPHISLFRSALYRQRGRRVHKLDGRNLIDAAPTTAALSALDAFAAEDAVLHLYSAGGSLDAPYQTLATLPLYVKD
jgi:2'-5' RNA ligase